MKVPSIAACIKVLGPTEHWKGNCFGMASQLVEKKLVTGMPGKSPVAVYGHWLGPIAEKSFFGARRGSPFCQHGWVLMPDGSIVDPTRWVFEDVEPYIFHGKNDFYDEGGNGLRMTLLGPPPDYDPTDKQIHLTSEVMDTKTWNFVEKILELDFSHFLEEEDESGQEPGVITRRQLSWLANLSPSMLGEHQAGLYEALEKLDQRMLIPLDNYRAYERTKLVKKRK